VITVVDAAMLMVNTPSTYEVGVYEEDEPPEQCVTYVPAECWPDNGEAKPVSAVE
jgi:hypothetical protein